MPQVLVIPVPLWCRVGETPCWALEARLGRGQEMLTSEKYLELDKGLCSPGLVCSLGAHGAQGFP